MSLAPSGVQGRSGGRSLGRVELWEVRKIISTGELTCTASDDGGWKGRAPTVGLGRQLGQGAPVFVGAGFSTQRPRLEGFFSRPGRRWRHWGLFTVCSMGQCIWPVHIAPMHRDSVTSVAGKETCCMSPCLQSGCMFCAYPAPTHSTLGRHFVDRCSCNHHIAVWHIHT